MIILNIVGLGCGVEIDTVIHFNKNERMLTINTGDLCEEDKEAIIKVLNRHLSNLGVDDLLRLLSK